MSKGHTPGTGLRRGSVAFVGTVGSAVGIQAPAAGVSFLPALMAGIVGVAGPVSFASAVVVMLFVAYAFVVFTREFASAGSVYSFSGRAMGPGYGLFTAWLLLLVYVAFAGSVFASNANALVALVAPQLIGTHLWLLFALALWAATMTLTRFSIRVSTGLIFGLEAASLALVGVVAVIVLTHQGSRIHQLGASPISPVGVPIGILGPGIIFAFTGFSGFEVAATLGEESRAPRRIIPAAMVTALVVSGLIYAAMSYVETVAYPSAAALAAAAEKGVPLASIAEHFAGSGFGTAVIVASIISGFGAQLATVNGASRLLFAIGRSGVGPAALARTHPRYNTPTVALTVVAIASIVPVLALFFRRPLEVFGDLATYGADVIIIAYLLTIVAALVFTVRQGRHRVHLVRILVLIAGILLIGYVIEATVWPLPAGAPLWYLIATAGSVLAGGILVVGRRAIIRRRFDAEVRLDQPCRSDSAETPRR